MKRVLPLLLLIAPLSLGCRNAQTPAPQAGDRATPAPQAGDRTPAPQDVKPGDAPASSQVKPLPEKLPEVLAKVNGEPVERWELEMAVKRVEAQTGEAVPADRRNEVFRTVLDQLVSFHLLAQESRQKKMDVTDAQLEDEIARMRKEFPSDDAFQKVIAEQGLTLERLRRQTRMNLQIQKIVEAEVNPTITVSDQDVDAFYKQNAERFKQGELVHASHIFVAVPENADAAAKRQARAKAQDLAKLARAAGADFGKLARERSQDPGTAPNGGDVGFFPKGQMAPAFEEAAFALKVGAVSDAVELPNGFHVIKVNERRAPRTVPLSEVGPDIKAFLESGQRQSKIERLVEQAKSRATTKIEILV
jgi:peptidyl-prolyl cis-trans isomerase C